MNEHASKTQREVEEETINAYRVQRLSDGSIRIKSGGHVVTDSTYFEALQRYAETEYEKMMDSPEHLLEDKLGNIHDGYIPYYSYDTSGFTPLEILTEVTGRPEHVARECLDREHNTELREAFFAGFKQSGEGFNWSYGADEEDVRQLFEEWQCGEHEYGDWYVKSENPPFDTTLYGRVCEQCGKEETEWRDND